MFWNEFQTSSVTNANVCFAEKSSETPGGHLRLSVVAYGRWSHPDSTQQHREIDQSLSRMLMDGIQF